VDKLLSAIIKKQLRINSSIKASTKNFFETVGRFKYGNRKSVLKKSESSVVEPVHFWI
jgi:hypothetical protein